MVNLWWMLRNLSLREAVFWWRYDRGRWMMAHGRAWRAYWAAGPPEIFVYASGPTKMPVRRADSW